MILLRQRSLRRTLATFAALCLVAAVPVALAQSPADQTTDGPLQPSTDTARVHLVDNDTILRMHKAGLGDDVLIQTIQLQPGHYDTRPDDLIALKSAGLSDRVLAAMQAHGTGLTPRDATLSSRDPDRPTLRPYSSPPPADAAMANLPPGVDEIGVYYRLPPHAPQTRAANPQPPAATAEEAFSPLPGPWLELHTERVLFKSGGAAKSLLTHGIISKDMNGHLEGPKSSLALSTGVQILIYAPRGTDGEEYDFLRFRDHKDSREFRTLTGGVFHSETGAERDEIEFHPQKIAPQLYTFTVPLDIEKGEYGVLPPGSANTQGLAGTGKIFTFSIPE